jgi:hypothetical protein
MVQSNDLKGRGASKVLLYGRAEICELTISFVISKYAAARSAADVATASSATVPGVDAGAGVGDAVLPALVWEGSPKNAFMMILIRYGKKLGHSVLNSLDNSALGGLSGAVPAVVLKTPRCHTTWHPPVFDASNSRSFDSLAVSTDGYASIGKVIRAKITNKRRLIAFRRFWFHWLTASTFEAKTEKFKPVCFRLFDACRCETLCVRFWFGGPFLLSILVSLMLFLPLKIMGNRAASFSYTAALAPVLVLVALMMAGACVTLVENIYVDPTRLRKLRAAFNHRRYAIRSALLDLADVHPAIVDAVAPLPVRKLSACDVIAKSVWPVNLIVVGHCITIMLIVAKMDGVLVECPWRAIFAAAVVPMCFKFGISIAAIDVPMVTDVALKSAWLSFYVLLSLKIDDVAHYDWFVVFVPVWLMMMMIANSFARMNRFRVICLCLCTVCFGAFTVLLCWILQGGLWLDSTVVAMLYYCLVLGIALLWIALV